MALQGALGGGTEDLEGGGERGEAVDEEEVGGEVRGVGLDAEVDEAREEGVDEGAGGAGGEVVEGGERLVDVSDLAVEVVCLDCCGSGSGRGSGDGGVDALGAFGVFCV